MLREFAEDILWYPPPLLELAEDITIYPPLKTIANVSMSGIIINYPVCVSGISHLSSEVINIPRGEAEWDILITEEDKCDIPRTHTE